MRPVDVRSLEPSRRDRAQTTAINQPQALLERFTTFAALCALWGIILFAALNSLQ